LAGDRAAISTALGVKVSWSRRRPVMNKKWIWGRELLEQWGILDFDLLGFMREGLTPYTGQGRMIVDREILPRKKETMEEIELRIRADEKRIEGIYASQPSSTGRSGEYTQWHKPLTEAEIKVKAKEEYENQQGIPIYPPDKEVTSFRLPRGEEGASRTLSRITAFLFKSEDVNRFAKEHGLPLIGQPADDGNALAKEDQSTEKPLRRLEIPEAMEVKEKQKQAEPRSKNKSPGLPFVHSPDFRSIRKDGKEFTLTSKQAQVIQMLSEAKEAGTPDLGQGYVIEKVSGETSIRRIRDFFKADLDAWKALLEPGNKKGTFRLKI
jgi:hypothetical protein